MKKEALAILLGFLNNQKQVLQRILQDIKLTEPDSRERISHLGYLLHNLYCALEDIFREVAQTFENQIEDPARYHRELLKRMHYEIPQIRPPLLTSQSFALLNELRGFRHVFRHAYDYELTADRLAQLREKILQGWESIQLDLDNFTNFLRKNLSTIWRELALQLLWTCLWAALCLRNEGRQLGAIIKTKQDVFRLLRQNRDRFEALGVSQIGLFGSFLRREQHPDRDIDLLVEFETGRKTFDAFMELSFIIEEIFQHGIELVTVESLSPHIGPHILKEVEYAALATWIFATYQRWNWILSFSQGLSKDRF